MRMSEAVQLVLETIGKNDLIIPTWLPAYKVSDLATAMGLHVDVCGLPWWEKRAEGMRDGLTSDTARRLTIGELVAALEEAGYRSPLLGEGLQNQDLLGMDRGNNRWLWGIDSRQQS